ncbi:alkaline phosphatase family protein [Halopiger goleimassiliensis]|uniref:alkaline phosphatase family protein n=1 Tax=Halopiger goleimassiliensis TaxID=1293048 RepID=UPI000677643A|nr:alkaline phosphatase family protein [Halopiger goleimassiliensis]
MSTPTAHAETDRAFVLGIDGVPWDRLAGWIDAGQLPNFERLADEGACSPLYSTTPPTTPTAWPTIATGVRPDKHGIYGFQRLNPDYTQQMYTSEDRTRPALWNLLSPAVVGNVPMTYPASEIEGSMVAGMISPSLDERATHPDDLAGRLADRVPDYEIGLNWQQYSGEAERFERDLTSLLEARRDAMRELMDDEDWRLFFFVYTAPDRLQHLLWDDDVMLAHYERLDEILGEVIDYTDRLGANLFVVSDHGFGPISKFVNLNAVLANEGYLTRRDRSAAQSSLEGLGITKSAILGSIRKLGIDDGHLVDALPKAVVDRVASTVPGDHGLYDVDFAETVAFAHGPSHVYVNDTERFENGVVDPAAVPEIKRELTACFANVTDPETGRRALSVSDGDDLFPTDEFSPDLVVVGTNGYEEKTKLADEVFTPAGAKAASHRSEGVFLARGPTIEARGRGSPASVLDVAPTVLHSVGEPLPDDLDGSALTACIAGREEPTTRSVDQHVAARGESDDAGHTDDELDDVEDRLRGLGYME